LEGAYASNPYRGEYRVQEFKPSSRNICTKRHSRHHGCRLKSRRQRQCFQFNKVVPDTFRYNSDWTLNNDSGVGNVFASENPMAANFSSIQSFSG
jgi:pullulanase/glycogen debranching enzyme